MHPKLLSFRYRLFQYRHVERALASRPEIRTLLDIGCGDGENLDRFRDLPRAQPLRRFGLEISWKRLKHARHQLQLPVAQSRGEQLPFPAQQFDLIYLAHVLHHVADYEQLLAEIRRCLAPGGHLFLVETVTDHPILRWARRLHPFWHGDKVEADWRYDQLLTLLTDAGFEVQESGRYNLIFWLWEIAPLTFWPLELFTPVFVYLDLLLARWLRQYAVHCYAVLTVAPLPTAAE